MEDCMVKSLLPREEVFFDFFDRISNGLVEGCELLVKMLQNPGQNSEYAVQIKSVEHQTDLIVHSLLSKLHKTFVTPIDRGDIHQLASRLDDILDSAEAAASRVSLYCPDCLPPEVPEIAAVLLESVKLVREMVALLRRMKNAERILELTIEINRLEDQADFIRRSAVARLFREEKNAFELIKWKDILEYIERATDRCEDVANITEGIVLENS
jgi:predicted phosphate transport protein (TIGR00153 family)